MDGTGLISNITGEYQRQANLLNNTPNLIKVLVEDEVDVVVWHKILKEVAPGFDYQVSPYSFDETAKGKGKANVLKFADNFGNTFIGCVDSDFDWLLEDWTQDGGLIKNNKYILQTYAYSIENLASQPYGVSDCMLECVMHSSDEQRLLDKVYTAFIRSLSSSVYEVLLWHLLMWKNRIDEDEVSKGWKFVFGNDHYKDILTDHTRILDRLRERAAQRADYYNKLYPGLLTTLDKLKIDLSAKYGLTSENAYLFVRGHDLYGFLTHCFFNPVKKQLMDAHEAEIKAHNSGDFGKLINHYKRHCRVFEFERLYRIDYIEDSSNVLTKAISGDIKSIFNP